MGEFQVTRGSTAENEEERADRGDDGDLHAEMAADRPEQEIDELGEQLLLEVDLAQLLLRAMKLHVAGTALLWGQMPPVGRLV